MKMIKRLRDCRPSGYRLIIAGRRVRAEMKAEDKER